MLQLGLNSFVEVLSDSVGIDDTSLARVRREYKTCITIDIRGFTDIQLIDPFLASRDMKLQFGTISEVVDRLVDEVVSDLAIIVRHVDDLNITDSFQFLVDLLELGSIVATARKTKNRKTTLFFVIQTE